MNDEITKYRKKPLVVEAMQFVRDEKHCNHRRIVEWLEMSAYKPTYDGGFGLYATHPVNPAISGRVGDWFVNENGVFSVQSNFYFSANHEKLELR